MRHPLTRALCRPTPGHVVTTHERQYVLRGKIGNGAVGLVRKAEERTTRRIVAIKFLAPDPKYIDVSSFDDVAERFQREGQRGELLEHDRLVRILAYEPNTAGAAFKDRSIVNPFIVMEFVKGATLESTIANLGDDNRPMITINRPTLSVALAIAEALEHLHDKRIVHRDVKPANIFVSTAKPYLSPSIVKLGDFGVTKWGDFVSAATLGTLTLSAQRGLGTLKYMSPEQALKPKDVTVRSDMFSLGITLFELFTGRSLPSPHHVFAIMDARRLRTSITGKLIALDVRNASRFEEEVFEKVFELFASPKDRPTAKALRGNIEYWLSKIPQSPAP